jgi:nucleoside transporter
MPDHPAPIIRSSRAMMARMSAMMFLQYWPMGVWGVTVGTFIDANTGTAGSKIFSPGFIGYSTSAGAIGSLFSPMIIGFLSDRFFPAQILLALMHAGCAWAAWGMYQSESQVSFFLWLLIYYHCYTPACALTNKLGLRHLKNPDTEYPLIRLSSTFGWITAGFFIGYVWPSAFKDSIEATRIPFAIGAAANLVTFAYSFFLPHSPPELHSNSLQTATRRDSRELFRNWPLMMFLLVLLLTCVPTMAYNNFTNLFLNRHHFSHPAALMTLGQMAEMAILPFAPWLISRFGLQRLFVVGVAAWTLRYILLAVAAYYDIASPVYLAIVLQGPCFVFVYVVGVMFVDHLVAGKHRGAAQGIYGQVTAGVANLIGALTVGFAQATFLTPEGASPPPYHWTAFWMVPAAISAATIVLFKLTFHPPRSAKL